MFGIKLLLFLAGSGTIAGVTASKIYNKTETQSFTSNTKQAKRLAKAELRLTINLLVLEQTNLETKKESFEKAFSQKQDDLTKAQKALTAEYETLNNAKKELNTLSDNLKTKYENLSTKNTELATALKEKMDWELNENQKKLNKDFYTAQKASYQKTKDAITEKIKAIENPSSSTTDICGSDKGANWTLNHSDKNLVSTMETEIKSEVIQVCNGLSDSEEKIKENEADNNKTKVTNYDSKKKERDDLITEINTETQNYNSKINTISFTESSVKTKINDLNRKETLNQSAKSKLQEVKYELEMLKEKIEKQKELLANFDN